MGDTDVDNLGCETIRKTKRGDKTIRFTWISEKRMVSAVGGWK
jgi:hypothetical protein